MRVSDYYTGPYGLAYPHARRVWNEIRHHPLFVDYVLQSCQRIQAQIDAIRAYEGNHPNGIRVAIQGALDGLKEISDVGVEVAKDAGWGDPKDVMIAMQRHPLVAELLEEREALSKKRENLQVL
jgi:hypothetical protein